MRRPGYGWTPEMLVLQADEGGGGGSGGADDSGSGSDNSDGGGTGSGSDMSGESSRAGSEGGGTVATSSAFNDADLDANASLTKFVSNGQVNTAELGRSYVELERHMGQKGLVLPNDNSSLREIRDAMTKMGCPESAEGYGEPEGFTWPDGMVRNDPFYEKMKAACHQYGMPKHVWDQLYPKMVALQQEEHQAGMQVMLDAGIEGTENLKAQWGDAFNGKKQGAELAMQHVFGAEYNNIIGQVLADGTLLGANHKMVDAFSRLHEQMGDGTLVNGFAPRETLTPDEAQSALDELMGDEDFQKAWNDRAHSRHDWAVARRATLVAMTLAAEGGSTEMGVSQGLDVSGGHLVRG